MTRQAGYNFSFTTNASLLTPQLADELLEAGVGPLAFSVDATNQQTYQNLQQGNLAQVERNILDFQSRFLARYGYFSGTMSFVVSAENAHEQEAYKQKWLSRGFHVTFYARHDCQRNMRPYTLFLPRAPRRSPCLASWHTLFLNRAMQAVTCSWGSWATSPTAQSPTLVDRDAGLFWRKNPAYTTFAEHGRKLQKHCGHCTNWAEMQRQLTRTPQGELVSTALGSQTWIPSTENKTNG